MSEEAPRKRSRFDQTQPEPRKPSRFDRRSRSPSARHTEARRSRSPVVSRSPPIHESRRTPLDPAAAAGKHETRVPSYSHTDPSIAAAAAKINADLQARKGIQYVDVPPIRSVSLCFPFPTQSNRFKPEAATPTPPPPKISTGQSTSKLDDNIYIADGDYIKDIEVNDLRNRYTLTKGSTQKTVNTLTLPGPSLCSASTRRL